MDDAAIFYAGMCIMTLLWLCGVIRPRAATEWGAAIAIAAFWPLLIVAALWMGRRC